VYVCFVWSSTENAGSVGGIDISNLHLETVSANGMSGGPILSSTGVTAMIIAGEGAWTNAVSCDTMFQVLKRYHSLCLIRIIIRLKESNLHNFYNCFANIQINYVFLFPLRYTQHHRGGVGCSCRSNDHGADHWWAILIYYFTDHDVFSSHVRAESSSSMCCRAPPRRSQESPRVRRHGRDFVRKCLNHYLLM